MRTAITFMLIMHLLTITSIVFNIPILRQCFGFIYITFIPGFAVLRILRIREKNIGTTFLLSAGLSITFLMFTGLLMNELFPLFGVSNPLSTVPLLITITSLTLAIFFVGGWQDFARSVNASFVAGLGTKDFLFYTLFILLPVLSVVGALYLNTSLFLLLIIGIIAVYATSIFWGKLVPSRLHLFIVFTISMSLLFHTSLISKHIMGWDIFNEYYVFKLTETVGYWQTPGVVISHSPTDVMNSILSVTILPTIYSCLLNLDGELIFKAVFPFIFSLVPLLLYKIFELHSRKSVALLSTFFFISNSISFYDLELISLARQMIGELFFVLAIFSLVSEKMTLRNKRIFFMIFSAALVVSHYSLSYIFLFYVISTFTILHIRGKKKTLNLVHVLFLVAITFSWYLYVSNPPLNKLIAVFQRMSDRFVVDIFEPQARLDPGVTPLSPTVQTTITGFVHKILIYITHFFVGIGAVVLAIKPDEFKFHPEFRLMAILSAVVLLLSLGIPNFAPSLNLTRFYQIVMLLLAPFFALGGMYFLRLIGKFVSPSVGRFRKFSCRDLELRILTVLLIAFFIFQVGFVNHVTKGYPSSYSLDFNRKKGSNDFIVVTSFYSAYAPEQDVSSARWLSKYMNETFTVYADANSKYHVLPSYALLAHAQVGNLFRNMTLTQSSYMYLGYLNVHFGVITTRTMPFNITEISDFLNRNEKVYSNGGSDLYYVP